MTPEYKVIQCLPDWMELDLQQEAKNGFFLVSFAPLESSQDVILGAGTSKVTTYQVVLMKNPENERKTQ